MPGKLPQIIILYGPPNAGKGTQSYFLESKLPEYYHLDFGTELRKFVEENIGIYISDTEELKTSDENLIAIARRIKSEMRQNNPVQTADLRFVIESKIMNCVENGTGMIIEGPGRKVEEAEWLSGFLGAKGIQIGMFHLYISLDKVLERASHRYYISGSQMSYSRYEEALLQAVGDDKPYQRSEDLNADGTKQRYKLLYSDNSAKILRIYQLNAKTLVFNLDATLEIKAVSDDILKYLDLFYGVKL